jgi:hypothetical protein
MAKISVLTYGGEEWAAGRMTGINLTDGSWIAWGSGPGIANKVDTALFLEETEVRSPGIVSLQDAGGIAKYQVEGTLTATSPKTITNAGNFTADIAGTLIVHTSFDPIFLDTNDQITFTITVDPS